ncbi:general secretion pathway protein J [Inhella inkyongensis]|uniref:General secretion pathway protein J n=1 Tax=Inhella inkyongensis TaxID=392593 RepID=A0A840S1I0_9BURK|nr:prepilin-type N-terminal cleavage/methylation domain-containing protein [Inhella inkyongensis]MBB5203278.1 general secretion pathway protein J [Inhella inkyongensis]
MALKHARGFTLVEVLIALLVMAVMSGLAWRGVDAMLRSREQSQTHLERSARLQTVMAQLQQDLEQIHEGKELPALQFDGRHLRLTRRHPQGVQVVVWFVVDGALRRWADAPTSRLDALRRSFERGGQPLTLAGSALETQPGVSDWQLAYFFGNAWSNAQSTGDFDDPSPPKEGQGQGQTPGQNVGPQRVTLPQGLRITLQFAPQSGFGGPLMRQFLLGRGP